MRWTTSDLVDLIEGLRARRRDTTTVEAKAEGGCLDLARTLCAFANMPDGGTIVLGLDEATGFRATGLTDVAVLEQGIAAQARTAVTPPVSCSFQTVDIGGRQVLVCDVDGLPLSDRPARHAGQAYLRQSDGDYAMSDQEIAQIELQKTPAQRRTHPDRQAVPSTSRRHLDADLLAVFLQSARSSSPRLASVDDDEILLRTGVVTESGALTLAGVYALGSYPQQFLPNLSITAAVQLPRGSATRTRDLVHLDGPLPELLDRAMEWVRRNTRTSMGYDELGHGVDRPEVPMQAVREIVANALVHRNLDAITESRRVEIRLLDDRLVITSPGGLWGVSEQQLGQPDGKSAVNLTLYDLCRIVRMTDGTRVIEGEGGGIREALHALREAGLRRPRFIDAGVRFTVLLSRHTLLDDEALAWLATIPGGRTLSSEQRAVLASMRSGQEWTNGLVRERFAPIDSVDARRLLQGLVDRGLAEMAGDRGSASYRLTSGLMNTTGGRPGVDDVHVVVRPSDTGGHPDPVPARIISLGKHAASVWTALASPLSSKVLTERLALSERQVRYALTQLRDAGFVDMVGRPRSRAALYRRTGHRDPTSSTIDGE